MEFHATRGQLSKQILRGGLLLAASAACLFIDDVRARLAGAAGLLLFVPVTAVHLIRYVGARSSKPDLVIDERGVRDNVRGWDVPWEAVRAVSVGGAGPVDLLCFDVDRPERFSREPRGISGRIARLLARGTQKHYKLPEVTIPFVDVEPGIAAALQEVERVRPEVVARVAG